MVRRALRTAAAFTADIDSPPSSSLAVDLKVPSAWRITRVRANVRHGKRRRVRPPCHSAPPAKQLLLPIHDAFRAPAPGISALGDERLVHGRLGRRLRVRDALTGPPTRRWPRSPVRRPRPRHRWVVPGVVTRRHELSDAWRQFVRPPLPDALRGRERLDDRRALNGTVWKFRTGTTWRGVPTRHGPRATSHARSGCLLARPVESGHGAPSAGRVRSIRGILRSGTGLGAGHSQHSDRGSHRGPGRRRDRGRGPEHG
ncbi:MULTISPECIES: transposase [unclassified Streptomyces]|uniref:transposase n=1 Tax=Streptomyces TaxID=1883 RepID=UPI0034A427F9